MSGYEVERCASGRLREAYPVAEHDVEVRVVDDGLPPGRLTELLRTAVAAIEATDPACRRIVYAAPAADGEPAGGGHDPAGAEALARIAAAEQAGFRYVVDVDLPGASLSLLVAEPAWVTRLDTDPSTALAGRIVPQK